MTSVHCKANANSDVTDQEVTMLRPNRLLVVLVIIFALGIPFDVASADSWQSTRVTYPDQHARTGPSIYPYRAKSEYILKELDLKAGDVVVDIGAGDGWWAERMARFVGNGGIIYASEIDRIKVNSMKEKFADVPCIRPYLCEADSTNLAENSCDLAFLSQTYHHLNVDGRVDYLCHLHRIVKPMGRLCVIERYPLITTKWKLHGTMLSRLLQETEQAGWVLVRCELMVGTYHYMAIFVQKDLFSPEP
jgi:tRNA A58 N-methylase Trm61